MVHSHPVLAFFDFGTLDCLISDSLVTSYSTLICMDASRGLVQKMGVITNIIRQTVSLHKEHPCDMNF